MTRIWIAALLALAGCGGSMDPSENCNVTLSGTVAGSLTCTAHYAGYASSDDIGGFEISAESTGATPMRFSLALLLVGRPITGTLTERSGAPLVDGWSVVLEADPRIWDVKNDLPAQGGAVQGSFSLVVRDLGSSSTKDGVTSWPLIHGTLNATLEGLEITGTAGTVTLVASF
jgi:hypothetical protein